MRALAFDVYGTLIDPLGIGDHIAEIIGQPCEKLLEIWRSKQLEYTFRRAAMNCYVSFDNCVEQALEYALTATKQYASKKQKKELLELYHNLPPFTDATTCLKELTQNQHGLLCFAFSNGTRSSLEKILHRTGLKQYLQEIVSANDVQCFKPAAVIYEHFLEKAKVAPNEACLVSGNSFDIIGALQIKMKAIFLQRSLDQVLDPWGHKPTATIQSRSELPAVIARLQ